LASGQLWKIKEWIVTNGMEPKKMSKVGVCALRSTFEKIEWVKKDRSPKLVVAC